MKILEDLIGLKECIERSRYAVLICIPDDASSCSEMLEDAGRIAGELGLEVRFFAVRRHDASQIGWFIRPDVHPLICFFAGGKLVKTLSSIRHYHGLLRELREVLKIDVREPVKV